MNNLIRSVRSKSANESQTQFRSEQETCVLCDSKLHLKTVRVQNQSNLEMVREIAECPKCQVRARSKDHQLQ